MVKLIDQSLSWNAGDFCRLEQFQHGVLEARGTPETLQLAPHIVQHFKDVLEP